jgi:hypothetical protein
MEGKMKKLTKKEIQKVYETIHSIERGHDKYGITVWWPCWELGDTLGEKYAKFYEQEYNKHWPGFPLSIPLSSAQVNELRILMLINFVECNK